MPEWLLTVVTNAGPGAIFAAMWWQERQERKEMTGQLLKALDKQVDMGDAVRAALRKKKKDAGEDD